MKLTGVSNLFYCLIRLERSCCAIQHVEVKFEQDENGKTHVKNGKELLQYSKELLEMGENLAVFPEGKLSHELKVLDFKLGYFRLAKETNVPILPIAMWGNDKLYPPVSSVCVAHLLYLVTIVGKSIPACSSWRSAHFCRGSSISGSVRNC